MLRALPAGPRYAIEFRHESWITDEVLDKLRDQNIACVSGDTDDRGPRRLVTADFIYARLRRGNYTEGELDAWDEWFRAQLEQKRDVLAYLKHDDDGTAPGVVIARWGQAKAPAARESVNPFGIGIPLILVGGVMLVMFPPVGLLIFGAALVMMVWGVAAVFLVRREH